MEHIFIVNPISGKADASLFLVPQLIEAAKRADVPYKILLTERPRHAVELAQQAAANGAVRCYACGGDGTLNEVFEGVWRAGNPQAEVASVPCGSGNDFIRNFGVAAEFLDIGDSIAGHSVPIDLMRTHRGVAAAICSVGVDAEVAYRIPKYRRLPFCGGQMAYNLSIVERLLGKMGRRLAVEVDGRRYEDDYLIVTICNGTSYGGGYLAAPTADLQDGTLEVVLVKKIGRLKIAGVLAGYKRGAHIENGRVAAEYRPILQYLHAKHVRVTPCDGRKAVINIDGECGPDVCLEAQVLPGAARFVLPGRVYARFAPAHEAGVCAPAL